MEKDPKEKADELLQRCGGAGDKALVEVGLLILEQLEQIANGMLMSAEQRAEALWGSPVDLVKGPLAGAGRTQHIAAVEAKAVRERMPKAQPEVETEAQPGG